MSINYYEDAVKELDEWVDRNEIYNKIHEMHPNWVREKELKSTYKNPIQAEIGRAFFNIQRKNFPVKRPEQGKKDNIKVCYDPTYLGDSIVKNINDIKNKNKYNRTTTRQNGKKQLSNRDTTIIGIYQIVAKLISGLARTPFHVDHANPLKNKGQEAEHPNNLHILIGRDNQIKSSKSCRRFTWKEQVEYIEYECKKLNRLGTPVDTAVVLMCLNMLKDIYNT